MTAYRILTFVALPLVAILLAVRLLRRQETAAQVAERLGAGRATARTGPRVWVHGASLGELISALPLIEEVAARMPGVQFVITANTASAHGMVRGWGRPDIQVAMAPFDNPFVLRAFLNRWRPVLAITLENELWPARMAACEARGIPVVAVAARLSERSAARWRRFPGLARRTLGAICWIAPLDAENSARFQLLGVDQARLGAPVNLKSAVQLADPDKTELERLAARFPRDRTVLAASTHEGDEALVLAAFLRARVTRPELRLIIAPRHPDRAEGVAAQIAAAGLAYERRSATDDTSGDAPVMLADTFGEMALWYTLAGMTVIGGTFSDLGGHTPVEPVQFGSVVVHGPDVSNHAAAFAALHERDAALRAGNEDELAAVLAAPPGDLAAMATRAAQALGALRASQAGIADLGARIVNLIPPGTKKRIGQL